MDKKIYKQTAWFIGGTASVSACILLFGVIVVSDFMIFPETLFWSIIVDLLPLIIPCIASIILWKKSKMFGVGVACVVISILVSLMIVV